MKVCKKLTADRAVTFEFADDTSIVARVDDMDEAMVMRLAVHGLSQKIGDSYASASNVAEAVEKAQDTLDMLLAGDWSVGRESGGGILVEALKRATGQDLEECARIIKGMDDAAKKELKKHPGVASKLADITAERAKAKADKLADKPVDVDALAKLFA